MCRQATAAGTTGKGEVEHHSIIFEIITQNLALSRPLFSKPHLHTHSDKQNEQQETLKEICAA